MIIISFDWGTNMDNIIPEIREKINSIEDDFPEGVERPGIVRFNPEHLPSIVFNISTRTKGIDIRRLAEKDIVPEIEKLEGVADVELFGGWIRAVTCKIDLDAISKLKIPITRILQVFQGENISLPGGAVSLEDKHVVLRTLGEFQSLEDIGNVLVDYRGQVPIFLKEVAQISLSPLPREQFLRTGGYEGVQLEIRKQPGHNTVEVNTRVKDEIERLKYNLPPSLNVEIETDQSKSVLDSIGSVGTAAWQGGLLAILVLLFFLRNIRSTLIISVTIPVSVVATFSLMYFAGITMNILSLLGITVGIGMFVDNAIVVLESSFRKQLLGMGPMESAVIGTGEVARAITASTLTTVAVFFPLVFVEGIAGMLFRDLAYTISFALLVSLFMGLSLIPLFCSRYLKLHSYSTVNGSSPSPGSAGEHTEVSLADMEVRTGNRIIDGLSRFIQNGLKALDNYYERVITWAIHHSLDVILGAIVLLALSIGSILLLGMEFLPEADEGEFSISLETRVGSLYRDTEKKVIQVEEILKEILQHDMESLSSSIGRGGKLTGSSSRGSHFAIISVTLVGKDSRERSIWQIVSQVSKAVRAQVTDLRFQIQIEGMSALASVAIGEAAPLVVELSGHDLDEMYSHALRISAEMRKIKGCRDVEISHKPGKPELQLRVKRKEAAGLGLSPREIALTIRTAYKGATVSRYSLGGEDYDVVVLLREEDRNSLDRIKNLFFVNPAGIKIPLENVVSLVEEKGPISIERAKRSRTVKVTGALTGERALNRVMDDIRRRVGRLGAPPSGVSISYTGSEGQMKESFEGLFFALILAVVLVYMVMASQFESFLHPLIVMFSIPFAIVGLVAALLITNTTFSMIAFIGGIMLVGIVVNNAIVLIDYMNLLRKKGLPLEKAIIIGGRTRLKPILMTTFTTIFALLPSALGIGTGAELRTPIGRAVIGGLSTSTLVTLVLIPTIYWMVESRRRG
ncbi:Swarming motility protein SwrC [subsurface metagenome]